jgi:signal transduction histidine kinase/CheY-like chemotaxis protein
MRVVGRATCAAGAMRLAGEQAPDLVLVDVELGTEDGIDLARRLTEAGSCGDVVLISLRDRGELAERIADSGAAGFLRKDHLSVQAIAGLLRTRGEYREPAVRDGGRRPDAGQRESAVAGEQADLAEARALRRVATLVAQGAEPDTVFSVIAREAARILRGPAVGIVSYDARAGTFTKICGTPGGQVASEENLSHGQRWQASEFPDALPLLKSGEPSRIDDWTAVGGQAAARYRALGLGPGIAVPILVRGALWGYISAYVAAGQALPPGCQARLAEFTQLMAIAIGNMQARDELRALADAQGALRRVATLVAQGAEPQAVFQSVAFETSKMLGVGAVSLVRYDPGTRLFTKIFGTHGDRSAVPDGGSWGLPDCPEGALILETGGPVRIDDWTLIPGPVAARHREQGFGQCVAAPILIGGRTWGHIAAFGEADEVLPPGSQTRLAEFTQLMATAIANVQVRDELRSLAERQGAALRRVATLVAQQASQEAIFNAVASEASRALGVARVDVARVEGDGRDSGPASADSGLTLLGSTGPGSVGGAGAGEFPGTARRAAAGVLRTGKAARVDDADAGEFRSVVSAPIRVDGGIWGVITVLAPEPLPPDIPTRLTDFTHLVASSISNVQARDNLIASRARIVAASDETRRRIERNLHDGIQQRVLAVALNLRAVRVGAELPPGVRGSLDEVAADLDDVLEEIRVFSQGLHPALLSRSGLAPAIRELARRSPLPVVLDVVVPGLPEQLEIAVYYAVSEALANAAKHAAASEAQVRVGLAAGTVRVTVSDDGRGGAVLGRGSGLIGLVDRVEALGGKLVLDSPAGQGTTITIELPLGPPPRQVGTA